jgi:hypothetical protein
MISKCAVCGKKKSTFIKGGSKGKAGAGFFGDVGDFFSKPSNIISAAALPARFLPGGPAISTGLAGASLGLKLLGHGVSRRR